MKQIVLWHLPYGVVGGVETLYATILKYIDAVNFEHHITAHRAIEKWTFAKIGNHAHIHLYDTPLSLTKILQDLSPDLIVGTHGRTLYTALENWGKQVPVIEIVHGCHMWSEHNALMPKNWTKHIVCVSNSAKEVFLNNTSVDIPTSVILNGVDTALFYPRRAPARVIKTVAYFGRFLEEDKHITKILQAFRSLGNSKARLLLVGGNTQDIIRLTHFSRKLSLAGQLKMVEHCTEPEHYYNEVDMVTVRSEAEGYCNTVAEALASGVPCVCYNFRGILEHLEPGTVSIANSQNEYAKKMSKVFQDYDLRQSMIQKGKKFIETKGGIAITVQRYAELFNQILVAKKHASPTPKATVKRVQEKRIVGVSNPWWHGIYTATKNCTDVVVDWHKKPEIMVQQILSHLPRAVLFSGGCPGFDEAARILKKRSPKIPIHFYYHGGMSHFSFNGGLYGIGERDAFEKILELSEQGIIDKIAVSSPGLSEVLGSQGYTTQYCGNVFSPQMGYVVPKSVAKNIHIGNFNRHHDHKHTSIGIGAVQLIKDSELHMLEAPYQIPGISYEKVHSYKEMPQEKLYDLYRQMTVCLQLSFIETFNISVLEMWHIGVPVILGPGNFELIKNAHDLKSFVYVEDHTNPVSVARHIKVCSESREFIIKLQHQHLSKLNTESKQRWEEFFS